MPKPLSLRKAAHRANIPPSTFSGYLKNGLGPKHVRLHGVFQIAPDDLDAWLAARTVEAAQ
ncbi:MAG: hypothetical protein WBB98_03955 [Xanthobacteraceae bacterium]